MIAMDVRTYPVNLGGGKSGMPTSLFDPAWQDPAVAARVAFMIYCRVPWPAPAALERAPVDAAAALTDERRFPLVHVHTLEDGTRFKGGSYGELHRRYAFGNQTANFHAQAVAFGVDDKGRFVLTAVVGRFDGPWGNDATLSATFLAGKDVVGSAVWRKQMDPAGDHRVIVAGQDAAIAAAFDRIDGARVCFTARTGIEAPEATTSPKLSRARRSVLEGALKKARAAGDTAEIARIEAALGASSTGKP